MPCFNTTLVIVHHNNTFWVNPIKPRFNTTLVIVHHFLPRFARLSFYCFNTTLVIVHRFFYFSSRHILVRFNTTLVIVHQHSISSGTPTVNVSIQHLLLFITTSTLYLANRYSVSIQHLLLFINKKAADFTQPPRFQYNTCYCSSNVVIDFLSKIIS